MADKKRRIIVVDDEQDFLSIVKLNLEDTGKFTVKTLDHTRDIVEEVNGFGPDLIIMDLLMPVLNGIEVCGLLKGDSTGKKIPIIVLTAVEKDEDKKKAYAAGAADYIVKPIEIEALINRIESVLSKNKTENVS